MASSDNGQECLYPSITRQQLSSEQKLPSNTEILSVIRGCHEGVCISSAVSVKVRRQRQQWFYGHGLKDALSITHRRAEPVGPETSGDWGLLWETRHMQPLESNRL